MRSDVARDGCSWARRKHMMAPVDLREAQISISADHKIRTLIADVRNNDTPTMWCLAKLNDEMNDLECIGSGTGSLAELAAKLSSASAYYGFYRTTETVDKTVNVKFAFITFLGEGISPMKKGKITTFKGTVTETFEPFHVELLNATSPEEVSDAAILELLSSMFGKATITDISDPKDTMRLPGGRTVKVVQKQAAAQRTGVAEKQAIAVPAELAGAILDVRSNDTPTNWCLCGYDFSQPGMTLVMRGSGTGGLAELASKLDSSSAYYGFSRTTDNIDKTVAVKFVFVTFLGESVPPMKKGKITTFKGTVTEHFEPFHLELLNATSPEEVNDAAVQALIDAQFGQVRDAVSDGHMRVGQKTIKVSQHKSEGAGGGSGVAKSITPRGEAASTGFESARQSTAVSEAVRAAIASVRKDDDPTSWCVLGYDADGRQPSLQVVGSGAGGPEGMQQKLASSELLYALVRVTQQVDRSTTVKFVLISWVGEQVAPMRKAKLSTLRGSATEVLSPFHAEMLNANDPAAVTHANVMALLEGK